MRAWQGWVLVLLLACGRTEVIGDPSPVAIIDAAPLALVSRELVSLDGSRSLDPLGEPLVFAWELVQRPPAGQARLETVTGARTRLRPDRAGTWRVALVVTAGTRRSEAASVSLEVRDEIILPVANAGDDQQGFVGDLFTLDGAQSRDPAGGSLTYEWSMTRAPGSAANLFGATTASPTFIADRPGRYLLTLQVKARNLVDTDEAIVTVGETNQAPFALIATIPDGEVGRAMQLDGTGSSDPDGEPITFEWRSTFPSSLGTLTNPSSATPTFVPHAPGLFTFELVVRDRGGLLGRTTGSVRIRPGDAGVPDAGPPDAGMRDAGLDAGSQPDAGSLPGLFDAGQVYLVGTVQPGLCGRTALADPLKPNIGFTGFTCDFLETRTKIRSSDGRLLYLNSGENLLRVFHCDACPYTGAYPSQPLNNDPVIPRVCPTPSRITQFLLSPDDEILHSCTDSPSTWRDAAGTVRYDGTSDELIAMGADGWLLTRSRVLNLRTGETRSVTATPSLHARWSPPDGFLFMGGTPGGTGLYRVAVSTGAAQLVGEYPPRPPNVSERVGSGLDRDGAFYYQAITTLPFRDLIVRCAIGGSCEIIYDELSNPLVHIHISSLVTGP